MLVSHRKQFIFIKSTRTAGTSVESYFEKYCMPEGEWQSSHYRDEYVSDSGIIGYRGPDARNKTWYNHMTAMEIRDKVGQDIWDSYLKFSTIRNPYEKMVSAFEWRESIKAEQSFINQLKQNAKNLLKGRLKFRPENKKGRTERFRDFILRQTRPGDRNKYFIGEQECIDYYIRFENLHKDLQLVCEKLSIDFDLSQLAKFKKTSSPEGIGVKEYYDEQTSKIIKNLYQWEIEKFGYTLPE